MLVGGHYETIKQIGKGGMSKVFLAQDLDADGLVALKLLEVPPEHRDHDAEHMRRFMAELILTSHVQHPNVVNILDYGIAEETGELFIAMNYLQGGDLMTMLDTGGRMLATRAIPLMIGVLEALALAHSQGIVHKDIKPANLFLDDAGQPHETLILTDFGIAHRVQNSRTTVEGAVACTPQYGAPEYLTHNQVSPAVDVYQVGLVLVEMLTGAPVVNEKTAMLCLLAQVEGRLRIPNVLRMGPLAEFIHSSVHVDPAKRYRDAGEMLAALREVDARVLELSLDLIDAQMES